MIKLSTQKQPFKLLKKGAAKSGSPTQDGQGKKVVKSRWRPRNGCDDQSMAKKNLRTTIQVNLCP